MGAHRLASALAAASPSVLGRPCPMARVRIIAKASLGWGAASVRGLTGATACPRLSPHWLLSRVFGRAQWRGHT
jgi:hypothetical protein